MTKRVAPFGAWDSPIAAASLAAGIVRQSDVLVDGADVYWNEMRPAQAGRCVIVRWRDGTPADVIAAPFSARALVHEYGGRCVSVHEGSVVFSNFRDQALYRLDPGEAPVRLTTAGGLRFADPLHDAVAGRIVCVCEDHRHAEQEAVNTLVSVALDGSGDITTLAEGADFYSSPELSPDGAHLAWLSWDHPHMPWDSTRLWLAERDASGHFSAARWVAGGPGESIAQPRFSPDGVLTFVSDRTGWANLYRIESGQVRAVCPMEAEFARPQWLFGPSEYAYVSADVLVCAYKAAGVSHLARIEVASGALTPISSPYTAIREVRAAGEKVYLIAASPTAPAAVVELDLGSGDLTVMARSFRETNTPADVSVPEAISFRTGENEVAHAFFYRPTNAEFRGPPDTRPPCIVFSHGGPTSATTNEWRPGVQYWTSRGFAVVDVNYRGSTGYSRAYRERLYGNWGLLDVEDCVSAARFLVARGDVDEARLAIRGGSAGGYTTLMAVTFTDVFEAGASHYGVSDLVALAQETHKFESRYLDQLIGPYPEAEEIYLARSPLHFPGQIQCPMIFLQGLEDRAVPPVQAEKMVEVLMARGIPVAYMPFEGEQHGFRQAKNIRRSLESELYFYCRIFGLPLPAGVAPVEIANLG
jgi:dipeptidyl aminopeptidase/acylaminoacyl peptidase